MDGEDEGYRIGDGWDSWGGGGYLSLGGGSVFGRGVLFVRWLLELGRLRVGCVGPFSLRLPPAYSGCMCDSRARRVCEQGVGLMWFICGVGCRQDISISGWVG